MFGYRWEPPRRLLWWRRSLTREAAELFLDDEGKLKPACRHCGGMHVRACPRVKRLVFSSGDGVGEVEFWPDGEWSEDDVVWPEEIVEALAGPDGAEVGEVG